MSKISDILVRDRRKDGPHPIRGHLPFKRFMEFEIDACIDLEGFWSDRQWCVMAYSDVVENGIIFW